MILEFHPEIRIQKLTIGSEQAPLLVIDNFVSNPDRLVRKAASSQFRPGGQFYPGIRIEAPLSELARLADPHMRQEIVAELKRLGFKYVTLDLEGFRSGSLNAVVPVESLTRLQ